MLKVLNPPKLELLSLLSMLILEGIILVNWGATFWTDTFDDLWGCLRLILLHGQLGLNVICVMVIATLEQLCYISLKAKTLQLYSWNII